MAFRDEAGLLACAEGWWWLDLREVWETGFKSNIQCITPPEEGDSGRVAGCGASIAVDENVPGKATSQCVDCRSTSRK